MPDHVAIQMPLKRKLDVGAVCAPVQALEGSRFVNCPICSQRIAHYLINSHLDDECGKSTSLPVQTLPVKPDCLENPENVTYSSPHQGTGTLALNTSSLHLRSACLFSRHQDSACRHAR